MHAMMAYSQRYGLNMRMALGEETGTPGNYSDEKADAHIRDWFDRRYGTRQNVDIAYGWSVLLVRDDPWRLRLPVIFGTVKCVVERDLSRHSGPTLGVRTPPTLNILSQVEGMTQELAYRLSDHERSEILSQFVFSLDCIKAIDELRDKPYASEIKADVDTAIAQIFATPAHYGQSKWASSQAAEKLLKSFLKTRNVAFDRNHNIKRLAEDARTLGAALSDESIASVSISPGVRYGEIAVSLSEAIDAHYASLRIGRAVREATK
jgi:hypothetical protein